MTKSAIVERVGAKVFVSLLVLVPGTLAIGCANVGTDLGVSTERKETPPPPEARADCRVTGGGRIVAGENPDSFGGNAQPFRGDVDGEWNHVTHEGDHFHGDPETIVCFIVPGAPAAPPNAPANAIEFTGTGTWNGEEGCEFVVYIEDHGEPGTSDYYEISITCDSGAAYSAGDTLLDGNLQIHAVPPGHL